MSTTNTSELKRETLADYINLRKENDYWSVFNTFKAKFPNRNPEEAIYSHHSSSYHDSSYGYYKFADELDGDMFVTMQRSDTWRYDRPYDYAFFYEPSSSVYKNSNFNLERLMENTAIHNINEIRRHILKRDKLKALYNEKRNVCLEIAELKRNRLAAIDAEITALTYS